MKIGQAGLKLIQEFEGYHTKQADGSVKAYLDKLPRAALWSKGYRGLWTIGWGNTGKSLIDGSLITEGTHWSRERAERELLKMIESHERAVLRVVKVDLDQNEFDALVSLSYNMGIGKAKTLIARLNKGDKRGAANAFLMYNRAGGRPVRGLTRRRTAERELFLRWTPKDLRDSSTTMSLMSKTKQTIGGIGITTAGVQSFFFDVWGWVKQNPDTVALTLLGVTAVVFLLADWVEKRRVKEHNEGRYFPPDYNEDE